MSSSPPLFRLKMGRLQILVPLLLLCLMLPPFQLHYASPSTFQETTAGKLSVLQSVAGSSKISNSAHNSGNRGNSIQTRNRKEAYEKKVRKTPSGPSPVGNNRPPSKA